MKTFGYVHVSFHLSSPLDDGHHNTNVLSISNIIILEDDYDYRRKEKKKEGKEKRRKEGRRK